MKYLYFIYQLSDAQTTHKNTNRHHAKNACNNLINSFYIILILGISPQPNPNPIIIFINHSYLVREKSEAHLRVMRICLFSYNCLVKTSNYFLRLRTVLMRIQHTASLSSKNSLSTGSRRIQTRRHAALELEQEQEQETMSHSHRILIMWARVQLALFGSSNWPSRSQ